MATWASCSSNSCRRVLGCGRGSADWMVPDVSDVELLELGEPLLPAVTSTKASETTILTPLSAASLSEKANFLNLGSSKVDKASILLSSIPKKHTLISETRLSHRECAVAVVDTNR